MLKIESETIKKSGISLPTPIDNLLKHLEDRETVYYKQSADLTLIELFTSASSPIISPASSANSFNSEESIKLGIFDNVINNTDPSYTGNFTKLDVCFKFVDGILKYDVYFSMYNVHYLFTLVKA